MIGLARQTNELNRIENKRLVIGSMALRHQIWERNGERTRTVDRTCGDYPRWIDTSVMIADPLTKAMNGGRLVDAITISYLDLKPTGEPLMIKEKNRMLRKAAKKIDS